MTRMITMRAPIALAVFLATSIGATAADAASATKQHHARMAMHASHHGMMMDHRKHHMAMMKKHGVKADSQHKAMMRKMHAMHHAEMASPTMRAANMPAKQPGSCGTYM
jgi:hypothetical protein